MSDLDLNKIDLGSFGINEDPLNANLSEALKTNPDQHAKALKLSQESGVPTFAVQSNPAEVEHKLKLDKIDVKGLTERAPATAGFLSNFDNAVIAQEDVAANLLEGIERTFKGLGGAISTGFDIQTRGAMLAANEATSSRIDDLVPFTALPIGMEFEAAQISRDMASNFGITTDEQLQQAKAEATNRLLKEVQDFQAQRKALTPEDLNILQEGVRAGIESIAMNAPGVALAVLTGGRAAPALVSMGAQTFAGSYGEGRAEGLTPEQARWYASIDAAIEVGTEILPTGTLERMLTGKSGGLTKDALKFMVQEMGTEQLATLGQSINAYAFGLDKEMEAAQSVEEMVQIQLRRQAVTAVATLVAGGAQATAVSAANKAIERLSQTEQQAESQAAVEQRTIDKLAADAAKSKLRERDVETFKQFIRDTDGEITNVFIDGPQASLFLQSKTREEIEADPALKALQNAVRESRATGADVAIPVDQFMGEMAGTDTFTALREHMTLSADTVSPFRQEQHKEETRQYVDRLMADAQENVSEYVEAQNIYTQVRDQLVDTGMVSPTNASVMAQVVPAWATAQAKRTGRTVKEVYEAAGLRIEGPQTGEMARLSAEALSQQKNERLQQAAEQGFDIENIFYHGTSDNISAFDLTKTQSRDSGFIGTGVYVTGAPSVANYYANTATPLQRDARGDYADPNVMPLVLRTENTKQFTLAEKQEFAKQARQDPEFSQRLTDQLKAEGYDSAEVRDANGVVIERVVFDPAKVRSVYAQFDAGKRDSTDLLAQEGINQLPRDRVDVYRAYARMEGSPEELAGLTKQFADQNERLFSIENKPAFVTDELLSEIPNPAFIVGKVQPLAHIFADNGDVYILPKEGGVEKLSEADAANAAAKMLTPIYNEIRENSPEEVARRAQRDREQQELIRRQKRVENAPKATGDFDADLKAYADYAEDFREFQDLLSADMLDVSDRNRTRLARATIALDPEADTAANVPDTQPYMIEDARKYGSPAERAAANAVASKSKQITVYRAMPADAKMEAGDWVGLVKSYAKGHESNVTEGKAATRQKTISKEELYWYGADFNEWVYVPKGTWGDFKSLREVWEALAPGKPLTKGTTFEQSATDSPRNLFVAHNISEAGLAAADELGGLAAPSIAVANLDAGGFDQFGEITLLADPDVLNDPTFRTFDADIYSARQPRPVDELATKKVRDLMEAVSAANEGTGLRELHQVTEISDMDKDSVFHYWLTTVGKAPKQVKMKPTEVSKAVEGVDDYDLLESPAFKAAVSKKYQKEISALISAYPDDTDRKFILDVASEWFDIKIPEDLELRWLPEEKGYAYFRGEEKVSDTYSAGNRSMSRRLAETRYRKEIKESGDFEIDYNSPKPSVLSNELAEVRKVRSGIDTDKFSADLAKKNQNKKLRTEFKQWMSDTYADMLLKRKLFKGYTPAGDRKYAEYTLNNVVKEMTKTLQGGESFNYGVASVRARYANELSTKEKVQASRDKIISSEEMAKVKEEAAAKFEKALEDLKPFYKFDTESWGYGSDVAEAITQGPSAVREAFGSSPEANSIIRELGAYLAALPTEYFESKVQRAMDFSEFNTAVVPKGASKKTLDILKSKGIKIVRYDPSVGGSRTEVVSQQTKLLFQKQKQGVARGYYDPENSIIRLTEAADLSTFLHEFAHFMYEMELSANTDLVQSINGWFKRNAADVAKEANGYLGREQAAMEQSAKQTDTPEFKRWFGESKVVDENGDPLVVYHGTTKDFEYFDPEMSKTTGVFFSAKPDYANIVAELDGAREGNARVIPVYVSVKNPMYVKSREFSRADTKRALTEGFDGLITLDDDGNPSQVTVFKSTQIKSAIGNVGAFDPASPNILQQGTPFPQAGRITEEDVVAFLDNTTTGDAAKDAAIRRAVHEQFARGFETYLMEGKAPSIELRNAFRTFARWLAQIYRAIKGDLKVNLEDDMRQVFDRLLATEDQIAAAESRARVEPMFTDAAMAGMTEQEFIDYKARQEKVKDVQSETLRDKLIAAFTRKTQQWWKEEKADLVDEAKSSLARERVYVATARLKDGDLKLDHATVKEMAGEARTNKLGRTSIVIPPKLVGLTAKGQQGVHPDVAAAFLGYTSGAELLHDLANAPSIKEAAEAQADAEMLARHGDPFTDGTIDQLADEAVRNEERGKLILHELKMLARGTSQRTLDRQMLKAVAEERIGQLSFKEIHPAKYRKAEIRAAQEAARMLAEGNKEGAAQAKARQALNYYLGMAATDAKNNVTDIVDRMARYDKKKVREEIMKAEGGYWEQIEKILARFELRKSATLASVDKVNQDINTWMKERIEVDGDGLVLHNAVLNESYVTHWRNVAYSDLVGISDSVKNIEHVARYANKLTRMGEEIEFNKLVDRWVSSIEANGKPRFKPQRTDVVEGRNWGRWFMAQMTKIPFMASWLDGTERTGISHQVLVQPFTDAYAAELALWGDVGKSVMELIEGRDRETMKRHNRKIFIPEIQDSLFGHQVLAVALNTGNAGNLKKMLLGEGWANPDIDTEISLQNVKLQAVLQHMTKSDWEMVQTIWDRMEELYPQLADVHRRTTGLTPPKVEATPVETPYGTFKGGYYPVKYDPNRSDKAAANEDRLNAETESMFSNNSSIQASVNAGSTNARTGFYAPIRLSLDVVPSHFQEAIHYITHHDAVREVNRLIRDGRVSKAIRETLGPEEYAQLRPWLNDIAKDGREAPTKMFWDDILQRLRFGVTLGAMGFKASTGIIQISGLSNTLGEVGVGPTLQAMRTILGSTSTMKQAWDFAAENSKVLKHRATSMDREIKNAMKRIEGKRGVLAAVQEASMKHIALIQTYMVDLPSWHASYIKGMKEWGDEKRAFQYADWVIENVQGSGVTKDLARIMRGQSETGRMFTMFMTFFSSLWNLERDLVKGAKSGAYSTTTVAAKLMFLFTIPVLFEMLMRGEFFKEDEDDEDALLQTMLTKVAMYPVQSVPFVRDIANAVTGDFGYNITPLQSIIEQGTQTIPAVIKAGFTDEEVTKSQVKGATKFIGAAAGIPGTGQAWATGEHLYQVVVDGEELTMHQLLFGPEKK